MTGGLRGRDAVRETLAGLLDPRRRYGATLTVVGPPGMGKSAVLRHAAETGEGHGYQVFRAAGYPDEHPFAGSGLHQILRQVRRRLGPLPASLAPSARALNLYGEDAAGLRSRLLDGATALLGEAARRGPVLAVVDDVHMFDPVSRHVVEALAEPLRRRPVVVLTSSRPDPAHTLPAAFRLPPLSERDAATLLAEQPQSPVGRGRLDLLRTARGNPGALVELARIMGGTGTNNIRRLPFTQALALRQRYAAVLDALPPDTARLVDYAGTQIGGETSAVLLAATGLPAERAEAALADAVRAGILYEDVDVGEVVFCDPLVKVAVFNHHSGADRTRIHRAFAALLPDGCLIQTVHRAATATGPDDVVADALARAAGEAQQTQPFLSTVAHEWSALLSTSVTDARARQIRAVRGAGRVGQTAWVAQLAAEARLAALGGPLGMAVDIEVALALARAGRQRQAMDRLLSGLRAAPEDMNDFQVAATAGVIATLSGLPEHRSEFATLSAAFPELVLPAHQADAAGDVAGAVEMRLSTLAEMRSAGTLATAPEMWMPLVAGLLDLGRWTEAAAILDEAEQACVRADHPLLEIELVALRAALAALHGDGATARRLADSVWAAVDLCENGRLLVMLCHAQGLAALAQDDFESAYRYFRRLFDAAGRPLFPDPTGRALLGLAISATRAGETVDAAKVLGTYGEPASDRAGTVVEHATALLVEDPLVEARLVRAAATSAPFDRAMARYHHGAWLRRRRRYLEARVLLRAAVETFESLGAAGFAIWARFELTAAGSGPAERRPNQRAYRGIAASLSPQQRQVAELAVEGLSNKEIAARLMLSHRTVGSHLRNVYLKLGVSSRTSLRDLLAA
ncbi:AAA family ATPase [Paractinoplanes atraurantiacus]|uniref:Regulatory protein, luxR family n=1 Tax=Paractinoplanes atraurantiacus TaxID=1036182 RepID=A0A285J017_9ACTN|nr:LuxR family transcriptional regulator [Actinoplanes atraurantiacus]SNY53649.1 regulatory protein, luxR family [Actinoplanes atraurantiacus]